MAIQYAAEHNLEELIGEEFAIVDFYSETCVPCRMFAKILEDISNEIPFINIIKVNTTEYPSLGEKYQIQAVPTVLIFQNGQQVERRLGLIPEEELKAIISKRMY